MQGIIFLKVSIIVLMIDSLEGTPYDVDAPHSLLEGSVSGREAHKGIFDMEPPYMNQTIEMDY